MRMEIIQRSVGITFMSITLTLATGCDTPGGGAVGGAAVGAGLGALIGAATGNAGRGAIIGAALGGISGGIIGEINAQQKAKLQQSSPQTLQTIQHNDQAVAAAKKDAANPAPQNLTPLTADDIKALAAAGVKNEVIINEIKTSKTVYTQQDIDAVQQANPAVDASVIDVMKTTKAS
jgi:predicted lipid-binding transport protein (Tim44 family)